MVSAARGFRLALLCMALYPTVGEREKKLISNFVLRFMDCDLHNILKLFGERYNQMINSASEPHKSHRHANIFAELPNEFTMNELDVLVNMHGGTTKASMAIYLWKKSGLIMELSRGRYRKLKKA